MNTVSIVNWLEWFNTNALYNIPPTNTRYPIRYVINFFKAGMLPFCLLLMLFNDNFGDRAILYTALHGAYGIIWVLKDVIFGDPSFKIPGTISSNLFVASFLASYCMMPYLTITE